MLGMCGRWAVRSTQMFPAQCEDCCLLCHIFQHPDSHHGRVAGPDLQQTRPEDLEEEQMQAYGEDY